MNNLRNSSSVLSGDTNTSFKNINDLAIYKQYKHFVTDPYLLTIRQKLPWKCWGADVEVYIDRMVIGDFESHKSNFNFDLGLCLSIMDGEIWHRIQKCVESN